MTNALTDCATAPTNHHLLAVDLPYHTAANGGLGPIPRVPFHYDAVGRVTMLTDPQSGRFLQQDRLPHSGPGGQGWNRSAYVANNPVNAVDPSGHCGVDLVLDAAFIGYDVYALGRVHLAGKSQALTGNLTALGLDVASAAIPCATGLGMMSRVVRVTDPDDVHRVIRAARGGGGSTWSSLGDLTRREVAQIQTLVEEVGRPIEGVGSAARGARRDVGTNLRIGKGPGTRSDIDYTIAPGSLMYWQQQHVLRRLPSLDPKSSILVGIHLRDVGPAIRFEPGRAPVYVPRRIPE